MWSALIWSHLASKYSAGDAPLSTLGSNGSRCRIPELFLGDDWKSRGAFDLLQVLACFFSSLYVLVCVFLSKKKVDQDSSQHIHECSCSKRRGHTWQALLVSLSVTICIYGFQYFATGLAVLWVSISTAWRYAKQTCFESSGFTSFSVINGDGRGLYGPLSF